MMWVKHNSIPNPALLQCLYFLPQVLCILINDSMILYFTYSQLKILHRILKEKRTRGVFKAQFSLAVSNAKSSTIDNYLMIGIEYSCPACNSIVGIQN